MINKKIGIIAFIILIVIIVIKCSSTGFTYDTKRIYVKAEKINENQINITGGVVDSYTGIKSYSYKIKKRKLYIKFKGELGGDKKDVLGYFDFNIPVNDKDYDEIILDGGFNDKKTILKK